MESILPEGYHKIDSFATNASYEFTIKDGSIGPLFQKMEMAKNEYGILDWGMGQTTLEEVFVKIISESDAQAEY